MHQTMSTYHLVSTNFYEITYDKTHYRVELERLGGVRGMNFWWASMMGEKHKVNVNHCNWHRHMSAGRMSSSLLFVYNSGDATSRYIL